jgi:hypothetical protein
VDLAFKAVGDLADEIILVSNSSSGFDFATGQPIMGTPTTKIIRGVVEQAKKESLGSYELSVMCKAADVGDPSIYDRATVRGVTYAVITPNRSEKQENRSNGYTHYLYLAREKV